jgi:hypothetical protein
MPIIGKHHIHPYSNAWALKDGCGGPQGEDEATVLLINTYRTPVSGVFRRKDFWFRGLWRKPGQRFAVCGGNPAWQQWRRPRENGQRPASAHHPVARVGGQRVHLGDLLQEVERPELAAVPDHAFPPTL